MEFLFLLLGGFGGSAGRGGPQGFSKISMLHFLVWEHLPHGCIFFVQDCDAPNLPEGPMIPEKSKYAQNGSKLGFLEPAGSCAMTTKISDHKKLHFFAV